MKSKSEVILEFANAMLSADIYCIAKWHRFTPRMDVLWIEYIDTCQKEVDNAKTK